MSMPPLDRDLTARVLAGARDVLQAAWNPEMECCFPHQYAYPHLWLWDSCFHSIGWAAQDDPRAEVELASVLRAQLPHGFVPHMRYAGPTTSRGPLTDRSSYTQPPIHAHALHLLVERGVAVAPALVDAIGRALEHLHTSRTADNGLVFIVHPWEAGTDDSPRWDDWVGIDEWDIDELSSYDAHLVGRTIFDEHGAASWSEEFVVCPANFNAITAWAYSEFGRATGSSEWLDRGRDLAARIDDLLWDGDLDTWVDIPLVGGGRGSSTIPTADGLLPALCTDDAAKRAAALRQLTDPHTFGCEFGRAYVPLTHRKFLPDIYWRGPAWPQLEYLFWDAARRHGDDGITVTIAEAALRGVLSAHFAEYWNPITGQGHGGKPQTWAAAIGEIARRHR